MVLCVKCNVETRKISSRRKDSHTGIFTRRRCFSCDFRFITWKPDNEDEIGEEFYSEMPKYNYRKNDKNRTKYF